MGLLTKKYILRSGKRVSTKTNKSITIKYKSCSDFNKMIKLLKYQSRFIQYSTGYPLRINFDTI